MTVYDRLGARRVINASGRMTALGGSVLGQGVLRAMEEAGTSFVDVAEFKEKAGNRIAELCGAEAGFITTGAAAGIAIMVAAVVAGRDLNKVFALPVVDWQPREIAIQSGHMVNFGASVAQMIKLGGGVPIPVGSVNMVVSEELAGTISPHTAAVLAVQSHHAVQKGMLPLSEVIRIAHRANRPVLLDAAAEEDLRMYVGQGADMVTYSGGKAIEGPTAGFIVGRRDLIEACRVQEQGIGRPMKIGKEGVAGLVAALEAYVQRNRVCESDERRQVSDALIDALQDIDVLRVSAVPDEAGRDIMRVAIEMRDKNGVALKKLVSELESGTPAVYVRKHHLEEGWVALDPRPLQIDDVPVIASRMRQILRDDPGNRMS